MERIYYFPFCQEGYWPTAYDALEEMRKIRRRGHEIDVYEDVDDAICIAETTVMEDETWIVVEIKVEENRVTINLAHDDDYEPIELDEIDHDLVQYFLVHGNV